MSKLLLIIAGGYLVILGFMYLNQHRMLYLPDLAGRELVATPAEAGMAYEDLSIETSDGVRLHGWWVPGEGDGVLLFFHGNAGNVSHRIGSIRQFHGLGLSVMIIDYRGYGMSDGRPTEEGTYRDAEAAWRFLTESRDVPAERVVLFGRSLGGAVAAWLAARHTPGGLIVESTFSSVPDLGQELYPFLPVRWLSRFDYSTRDRVAEVASPVMVVHSRDDEIIGFHHGQAIFDAASEPRVLLVLRGSHNDAYMVSEAEYLAGLSEFLVEHVLPPAQSAPAPRGWR